MVQKPDEIRICVDIPRDWHGIVAEYNKNNPYPLSLVMVCKLAIENEVNKLKAKKGE